MQGAGTAGESKLLGLFISVIYSYIFLSVLLSLWIPGLLWCGQPGCRLHHASPVLMD